VTNIKAGESEKLVQKAAAPALSREIKSGEADGADWMPAERGRKEKSASESAKKRKKFWRHMQKKKPQIN